MSKSSIKQIVPQLLSTKFRQPEIEEEIEKIFETVTSQERISKI